MPRLEAARKVAGGHCRAGNIFLAGEEAHPSLERELGACLAWCRGRGEGRLEPPLTVMSRGGKKFPEKKEISPKFDGFGK